MEFIGIVEQYSNANVKISNKIKTFANENNYVSKKVSLFQYKITIFIKINSYDNKATHTFFKHNSSLFFGNAFYCNDNSPVTETLFLNNASNSAIIENIWGDYIFIFVTHKNEINFIRSPFAKNSIFYLNSEKNDGVIFSSSLFILKNVVPFSLQYNLPFLVKYLHFGDYYSEDTAYKEISEVPKGYQLTLKNSSRILNPYWKPAKEYHKYNKSDKKNDEDNLISRLKDILRCQTMPYQEIILSFSGGLDSTALLFCIQDLLNHDISFQNKEVHAVNFYHPKIYASNELMYAKAICKDTRIKLIEFDISNYLPFSFDQSNFCKEQSKPTTDNIYLSLEVATNDLLKKYNFPIFLSGQGGDHLFMSPPSKSSIIDYLMVSGCIGLVKKLSMLANYYNDPYVKVIKDAIRKTFLKKRKKAQQYQHSPWYRNKINTYLDNTNENLKHIPLTLMPGKCEQINNILEALIINGNNIVDMYNAVAYPFLRKPIIDLALQFHAFDLYDKGYDRYILRNAVHRTYNTNQIWRTSKGETSGILQLGLKENRKAIEELCLHGYFSKLNLINKETFLKCIQKMTMGSNIELMWPLMRYIAVEFFIQLQN